MQLALFRVEELIQKLYIPLSHIQQLPVITVTCLLIHLCIQTLNVSIMTPAESVSSEPKLKRLNTLFVLGIKHAVLFIPFLIRLLAQSHIQP